MTPPEPKKIKVYRKTLSKGKLKEQTYNVEVKIDAEPPWKPEADPQNMNVEMPRPGRP